MAEKKKIWFPIKRYGWGWGPPCGWVVLFIYIALIKAASLLVPPNKVTPYFAGLTAIVFLICLLKGERPRWRWGK